MASYFIDLGTVHFSIVNQNDGIILRESSLIGEPFFTKSKPKLRWGEVALQECLNSPGNFRLVRPLELGVVSDFERTLQLLQYFFKKLSLTGRWPFRVKPRLVFAIPYGVTEVEKRAFNEIGKALRAKEVILVDEPMVTAIGAGFSILEPKGKMIIDVGGGTTEIAIIALGDIISCESSKFAGNLMTESIVRFFKEEKKLFVSEHTAEMLKQNYCSALPRKNIQMVKVRGRSTENLTEKEIEVSTEAISLALDPVVNHLIHMINQAIEQAPPEIVSDLIDSGIVLTGGGAMLKDLDFRIQNDSRLKVVKPKDPNKTAARGGWILLKEPDLRSRIAIPAS
jgi:rod shape-determining protein MreB